MCAYLLHGEDHFRLQVGVLDRQATSGGRRVRVMSVQPDDLGDLEWKPSIGVRVFVGRVTREGGGESGGVLETPPNKVR